MTLQTGDWVRLTLTHAQTPSPFLVPVGSIGAVGSVEGNGYCWVAFDGYEHSTLVDGACLARINPLEVLARCAK